MVLYPKLSSAVVTELPDTFEQMKCEFRKIELAAHELWATCKRLWANGKEKTYSWIYDQVKARAEGRRFVAAYE
jgi:hypothetical protein